VHAAGEKRLEQGARCRQHFAVSLDVQGMPAHRLSRFGSGTCVTGSQNVVDAQGDVLEQQGAETASVAFGELGLANVLPVQPEEEDDDEPPLRPIAQNRLA
jgi:hypothetical protein